jgi:hypothetical protein
VAKTLASGGEGCGFNPQSVPTFFQIKKKEKEKEKFFVQKLKKHHNMGFFLPQVGQSITK